MNLKYHKNQDSTHYNDIIMSVMVSQITGVSIVCSIVCSGVDQRKYQSSASLAFVRRIHQWPVDSPHKGPVTENVSIWWRHHVQSTDWWILQVFFQKNANLDLVGLWYKSCHAKFMGPTWAHLGPVGPRWAPWWPHKPCYQGRLPNL